MSSPLGRLSSDPFSAAEAYFCDVRTMAAKTPEGKANEAAATQLATLFAGFALAAAITEAADKIAAALKQKSAA